MKHPNIVQLKEIVTSKGFFFTIFLFRFLFCFWIFCFVFGDFVLFFIGDFFWRFFLFWTSIYSWRKKFSTAYPKTTNKKNPLTATKENRKTAIYMVFEYVDHDLAGLVLSGKWNPHPAYVKAYMKQLFEGLHHCHKSNILHRDLKGSNLLISNKGKCDVT